MAKPQRPGKGESVLCLPRDYTVVDTETTGLSTESCCLIEVSALRVREGRVAAEFSTLIRPPWREVQKNGQWQQGYVDDFIQGLTGITDEMLEGAPLPEEALPQVEDFLGRDLLLGHNVGFDTAFLYDSFQKYLGRPLGNNSLDQLRLVPYEGAHRALADCWITYGCYEKLRALALSQGTEEEFLQRFEKKKPAKPRYPGVPGHPFYQKTLVLTGSLDTSQNREAVLRAGGKVGKEVAAGVDFVAIPAPGEKPLPGKEGGPSILPQGAFYRLLGQSQTP